MQRNRIAGTPGNGCLTELHGPVDFGKKAFLHADWWFQFRAADKRVIPVDQLALERAVAKHLAIKKGLSDVIVKLRIAGGGGKRIFISCERLIVIEVVKRLVTLLNQ